MSYKTIIVDSLNHVGITALNRPDNELPFTKLEGIAKLKNLN